MQPVIGGESEGHVFLDKNKPYGIGFRFSHSKSDFHEFERVLSEVTTTSKKPPDIIIESSSGRCLCGGFYSEPCFH